MSAEVTLKHESEFTIARCCGFRQDGTAVIVLHDDHAGSDIPLVCDVHTLNRRCTHLLRQEIEPDVSRHALIVLADLYGWRRKPQLNCSAFEELARRERARFRRYRALT